MKRNTFSILGFAVATGFVFLTQSCQKDLATFIPYEPYTYSSNDDNGGTWKQILVTSGSAVTIDAPADVSSSEYQSELAEVKSLNSSITSSQQEAINYWGNNSMLRWMEITENLVAKYNLAPAPKEDGSYGVPDATNPDTYPYFPFAHPPYACRAYAYLAAAEYDALVSVWHYKYLYNRAAPYKQDASIHASFPDNNLPSYPSEDAAIAQVAEKVLTALFPLEADFITSKANELRDSRKWSGMNVQSDLDAGDSIANYVAGVFLVRAKTDSMKFAQVDKLTYQSMEDACQSMWGYHWENLEVPQRPVGITPKFGSVKTWWVTDVKGMRPAPPPAPGSSEYITAENELLDLTKHATNDQIELAYKWSDGFGTYTPAGHWDKIAGDYIVSYRFNPLRTARAFAYLNTAMQDAGVCCWDAKYYYSFPRPPQENADIKTLFGLPNFPSYTSGHSMFSGAAATVLAYIFPNDASTFQSWADEASNSRVYARIHFRFDVEAGLAQGIEIGTLAVDVAQADGAN